MKIGLDIDGVLRDFIGKLTEVYEKETGKTAITPITGRLEEHFVFDGGEAEFNNFIYVEYPLELFGHSKELTKDALQTANKLAEKLKAMGHELVIVSKQFAKSKSATLFFLSKYACQLDQIIFVQKSADKWKHVDIMIDDSPSVLGSKSEGKISVKYNQTYNEKVVSDYSISDVKELLSDELLDKILNSNYISFEEIKK